MDLECPHCGAEVKSGNGHTCSVDGKRVDRRNYPLKGSSKSNPGAVPDSASFVERKGEDRRVRVEEKKT